MPLTLRSGAHTVAGRREHNEDALRINADAGVFVVADGAGGRASGQVAARIACEAVTKELGQAEGDGDVRVAIDRAVLAAHRQIEEKQADPKLKGMATTVVVCVVSKGEVHLGHVGDSRAYLYRDNALKQLTRDHNLGNYLADNPHIKPKVERPASTLMRALGLKSADGTQVDYQKVDARPGDVLLLCTDGLSSFLPEWTMIALLRGAGTMEEAGIAEALTGASLAHGSDDNATAIVLSVLGEARPRRTLGWLTFLEGDRQGDVVQLRRAVAIGSADKCDVVITDPDAADVHTQVQLQGNGFRVKDLGKQGGTFINDVSVKEEALVDGDVIRIGGTRMVFKCHQVG